MPHLIFRKTPAPEMLPDSGRRTLLRLGAGLGLLATGGSYPSLASAMPLKLGQTAPALVLHTLDGHNIATKDLLGQVVIVTFWASWCEPCLEELPLLSAYAEQHAARGLRVLGFCLDGPENLADVKKIAAKLYFPVGLLGSPWAGDYGRMWRIPVCFVMNRAGKLVDNGWDDEQPVWTKERLHRVMDPLLSTIY